MKRFFPLVIVLMLPLLSWSQLFQREMHLSARLNDPRDMLTADIDGDGDEDIIVAMSTHDYLGWYENRGGNTFSQIQYIQDTVINLVTLDTADVDLDGDIDILAALNDNPALVWWENTGNGIFENAVPITPVSYFTNDFMTVDFNNDGYPDILAAETSEDALSWYENLGNGTFGPEVVLLTNNNFWKVSAGDLDQNGFMDIVAVTNSFENIFILNNFGGGNFVQETSITPPSFYGYTDVHVADLNNDQFPEIVYSRSQGQPKLAYLENLTNFNFGPPDTLDMTRQAWGISSVDIDFDNDTDIIVGGYGMNSGYYENLGGGNFGAYIPVLAPIGQNNITFTNCTVTDIDGDNDLDFVSAASYSSGTGGESENIFLNVQSGSLNYSERINVSQSMLYSIGASIFDFDTDGYNDIVRTGAVSGQRNEGNGDFTSIPDTLPGIFAGRLGHFDLDHDGDDDLVGSSYDGDDDYLIWWRNLGNGNYAAPDTIDSEPNSSYRKISFGDLDNDGWEDIIVGNDAGSNTIFWYRSIGGNSFLVGEAIAWQSQNLDIYDFKVGDLNLDGNKDVLCLNSSGTSLRWINNQGGGNATSELLISSVLFDAYDLGDLDGDGDLDIMTLTDNVIQVFANDGAPNFTASTIVTDQVSFSGDIELSDIDADGDLDVYCLSFNTNQIVWFENLGALQFSPPNVIHEYNYQVNGVIFTSDLDNDYVDDLIFYRGSSQFRQVLERFTNLHVNYCVGADTALVGSLAVDSICMNGTPFSLPGAIPAGGTFSGNGVVGNNFDPSLGLTGVNPVVYSYIDSNNCLTTDTVEVFVISPDSAFMQPLASDTLCSTSSPISLPVATPSGGIYSGIGVSGSQYDPSAVPFGNDTLLYTVSDINGCATEDTMIINVQNCLFLNEISATQVIVYPNPNNGRFTISGLGSDFCTIQITNAQGKDIFSMESTSNTTELDLTHIAQGLYFIRIEQSQGVQLFAFTKE